MSIFGTPGIRTALFKWFIKNGYGDKEGLGLWLTHDTSALTPLARFIYTRGVDNWEEVSNHQDISMTPKFDDITVLKMTLAGCKFSYKVCLDIQQKGWSNPEEDYFDKKLYKELCEIADDHERGTMIMRVRNEGGGLPLFSKTVRGKVCQLDGHDKNGKDVWKPVNP